MVRTKAKMVTLCKSLLCSTELKVLAISKQPTKKKGRREEVEVALCTDSVVSSKNKSQRVFKIATRNKEMRKVIGNKVNTK